MITLTAGLMTAAQGPDSGASEHVAGVLDATFDGDGIAVTEIASEVLVQDSALQVLPDGTSRLLVLDVDRVWRFLTDGRLDTSFDGDGVLVHDVAHDDLSLAAGPGGAFVLGGRSGADPVVTRFRSDGSRDPGFGVDGTRTITSSVLEDVDGCPVEHQFSADSGTLAMLADGSTVVAGPGIIGECDGPPDEGVLAVQLGPTGTQDAVHGARLCSTASSGTDLADPRSIQALPDGSVATSVAVQCTLGVDPVTVVRFAPGLSGHVEFDHSPFQPTVDRRLPLAVHPDGGFAVAAEAPDFREWNVLRWDAEGTFLSSTTASLPGIATGVVAGLGITDDGGHVVAGHVDGGAQPDAIGVLSFDADGGFLDEDYRYDAGGADVAMQTMVRLADGTFRLAGHVEPDVFGLDPDVQLGIARIDRAGALDRGFGGGTGLVQHHGGAVDTGQAVQVRPDLRAVAGGHVLGPSDGFRSPTGPRLATGFVLQHQATGPLDGGFSPDDRAGVEITRYAAPPTPVVVPAAGSAAAASTTGSGTGTSGVLAQAVTPVDVGDEAAFRDAFADPDVTAIRLTADITLDDCEAAAPGGALRAGGTDVTIDGAGHTITQDCEGHRILTIGDVANQTDPEPGTTTIQNLTLTGGRINLLLTGGAIATTGTLTVVESTVRDNTAGGGGGVMANSTIRIVDSTFVRNTVLTVGGAVFTRHGGISIVGSTFADNGGGSSARGGAIHAGDLGAVITGSTFLRNRARIGGAIASFGGDITVSDSLLEDNVAEGDFARGGAISTSGPVTVTGSSFAGNAATVNSAQPGIGSGGALWASDDLVVTASTFLRNEAGTGGAIRLDGSAPRRTVTNSTFEGNAATAPSTFDGDVYVDGGGGAISANAGPTTILRSSFVGNSNDTDAEDGGGGAIAVTGDVELVDATFRDNSADFGGAVVTGGSADVTESVFAGNVGGDYWHGGALYVEGSTTITESVFTANQVAQFSGGAVYGVGPISIDRASFTDNTTATDSGGAVYGEDTIQVTTSTFARNRSGDDGGAVFGNRAVQVAASTFAENVAASNSGALHVELDLTATNTTFASNSADGDGGAFEATNATLLASTVAGNLGRAQIWANTLVATGTAFWNAGLTTPGTGGRAQQNCDVGATTTSQFSWSNDATCGLQGEGDTENGADPRLGELADNGGPTQTMRPDEDSPLVNAIPLDRCPVLGVTTDQRGEARPAGPGCDIGSVEIFGPTLDVVVEGLALDASDRSVVAGFAPLDLDGAVHRHLPDGSPDPTFNGGLPLRGQDLFEDSSISSSTFHDVVVDRSGRLLVVGELNYEFDGFVDDIVVVRLLDDGTPDPSFGTGGVVRIGPADPPTDWDAAGRAITIDGLDRILVTGSSQASFADSRSHLLVLRLRPDGTRDATFGSSVELGAGTRVYQGPEGFEQVGNDIVTRGSLILVAGTRSTTAGEGTPGSREAFVGRISDIGAPDTSFGTDGLRFPFPAGPSLHSEANALAVDAIGNVVVTGGSLVEVDATLQPDDLLLARVRPDGTLDPLFGTGGMTATPAPGIVGGALGSDLAIAPDGKIVVTGAVVDDRSARVLTARYSPGLAELACTAAPADLGDVPVGTTVASTLTCRAVGGTVLVGAVTNSPTSETPGDFTMDPGSCSMAILDAGSTCTISLTFTPTAAGPRGVVVDVDFQTVRGPGESLVPVRGTGVVDGPTEGPNNREPLLTLTPEEGPVETEVEASASRFDPDVAAEVRLGDTVLATVPADTVGGGGAFTTTLVIPAGTPGGPQDVIACQRCGSSDERVASAVFTVTPRLFVTPTVSRPGGVVTGNGDGFPVGVPVRLRWNPGLGGAVVVPDANGEFRSSLLVFRKDRLGTRDLEAFISESDEVAATTPFLAVPGSSQPGDFHIRR